jgi:hypothetical protein
MDDTEYFTDLACRCCRGGSGLLKEKASCDNVVGSSVRNASRDIAAVLEATCRARRFEERRASPSSCSSSIIAGLDVQLRLTMMLLFNATMAT